MSAVVGVFALLALIGFGIHAGRAVAKASADIDQHLQESR